MDSGDEPIVDLVPQLEDLAARVLRGVVGLQGHQGDDQQGRHGEGKGQNEARVLGQKPGDPIG